MANIILNPDDMPTADELIHAVSRLRKCYNLLTKMRGSNDKEDPEALKKVASFLDMIAKREKKNLPKASTLTDTMEIAIDMVVSHLLEMDDWERHRTIEETKLKGVFDELRKTRD